MGASLERVHCETLGRDWKKRSEKLRRDSSKWEAKRERKCRVSLIRLSAQLHVMCVGAWNADEREAFEAINDGEKE